MKSTIFKIDGMNCDVCANTIKGLVEKEPGVQMASVSFVDRQARVLYDPRSIEEERLIAVIQKPGFRVVGRISDQGTSPTKPEPISARIIR